MKKIRKDIRVPEILVRQVSEYQEKEGVSTWTAALLELTRRGLESYNKEVK